MFMGGGQKLENREETKRELYTGSNLNSGWNQGPWSYEATVLPTTPPCCPSLHQLELFKNSSETTLGHLQFSHLLVPVQGR